jgi:cytochrome c biogenesis protein CcdA
MWWRPCVGAELGAILNGAQDGLAGEVVPMAAYMLGAILPVAVVVAISRAVQPPERATTVLAWGAVAVGLVVAASLVAGQHDEVVVTLTRWTLE